MKAMRGVVTAMLTPFGADGEVDLGAVCAMVDFCVGKDVDCLYPTGTTGEMYLLDLLERERIAETVIAANRGRAAVFVHSGAMTLRDTVRLSRHARDAGADGVGVVTPSYFRVSDREMEEYFVAVARSVPEDFPVYLYSIPGLSGNDIEPAVVRRIAELCPNVKGIKYSNDDLYRAAEYLHAAPEGFSVLTGAERLALPGLSIGCAGVVSGLSSLFPEPFVALVSAFGRNDLAEARRMQEIANSIVGFMGEGSNLAYYKAALTARGIDAGHMRRPLADIPCGEAEVFIGRFRDLLERLGIDFRASRG